MFFLTRTLLEAFIVAGSMIFFLQWILNKITKLDEIIRICLASLAFIPIAAVVSSYVNGNGELPIIFNGALLHGLSAAIVTPFLIMRAYKKPKT